MPKILDTHYSLVPKILDTHYSLVLWLALNRKRLTVFVHGLTGEDIYDHTELVLWLGESVELDLSAL